MKIFKVVMVCFFLCSVLFSIFLFVKLKSIDKTQIKIFIEKSISDALKKDVEIGKIIFRFSVKSGVSLNLKNINIVDVVNGKEQVFLKIDDVSCGVDVQRLLLKRVFYVKYIDVESSSVHLIRNEKGLWNFENSNLDAADDKPSTKKNNVKDKKNAKAVKKSSPKLVIAKIQIDDLNVFIEDASFYPPKLIKMTKGELQINGFSFKESFDFKFDCALFEDQKNLKFTGKALIDSQNQQIRFDDIKFDSTLNDISLEKMGVVLDAVDNDALNTLSLKLSSVIHQMIIGEKGVLVLSSTQHLEDGKVVLEGVPFAIEQLKLQSEVSEADIVVDAFSFGVASGTFEGKGRFSDYLFENNKINYEVAIKDINLQELIDKKHVAIDFQGELFGEFKGVAKNQKDLIKGLDGAGFFGIKNARLIDFNLLKFVLDQMRVIPNLLQRMEAHLSESEKLKLQEKDTVIKDSDIILELKNGDLYIKSLEIGTDEFSFMATGKINLFGQLDLEARLVVLSPFSDSLIGAIEEFSYLRNDQNQIVIPFIPFSGRVDGLRLYPDVSGLGKKFIKNKGRDELKRVIFKALDMEEENLIEGEDQSDDPVKNQLNADALESQTSTEQKTPERVLIENILDSIF